MRANPLSDWELRVGRFRVFYEVDEGLRSVRVLAVGEKRRERLVIGGREFKL
jgi:mRNA-degrading endonuclease RelE of RelBE toxin-antitoxin system